MLRQFVLVILLVALPSAAFATEQSPPPQPETPSLYRGSGR